MNTRIASLGMYDHPAQHGANDRMWGEIARMLRADGVEGVPSRLDRTRAVHELWRSPDLLFAQACGYPLTEGAGLPLRVLALPAYDVPDCDQARGDARHASVFVVRAGDPAIGLDALRGRRAAINDAVSNTGMNLLRAAVAPLAAGGRFFSDVVTTGAHRESVWAVVLGTADIAAIDAVTWAALVRFEPELTRRLRIVGYSMLSPTLPFVTADRTDDATVVALRSALRRVVEDPVLADARATLFLAGLAPAAADSFAPLDAMRATAGRLGYRVLA